MITRNVTSTLRPISLHFKRPIRAAYARLLKERGIAKRFDRKTLEDAIFEVENDLEHRKHDHPQVAMMRAVRNCLLDDLPAELGGNQVGHDRPFPFVEKIAAIIREKRRRGPSAGPPRP